MLDHVGRSNLLMLTLDTLRYDVAQDLWKQGQIQNLARYLPATGWERRHSPATFTYAAHHAFFAGFLPTPTGPELHTRLFASEFGGSETTGPETFVFPQATLPEALAEIGYRTICVGGTGFFNPSNSLGRVLPALFHQSYWTEAMSVVGRDSAACQVDCAIGAIDEAGDQPVFCFINFSAIHQPNWFFASAEPPEDGRDTVEGHAAALIEIDRQLPRLLDHLKSRGSLFAMAFSDHGTAYGEDGYWGHRVAHPCIWEVPYAEFEW
ncbi:STM4013/SEN3800 family hydrolase [Rhodopirellula sp. MGV]|uniref:STM4013/SEN3800 family hydrolase n=1 Tax=Rhodopirellula sp. MGV TaxID=2023130 RepID=UPI000B97AE3E|nr:STM4013/SEN3800 family hydrolase [Rhodopirellula sp. MGV]OYP36421.1 metalloenzyme domain-containing protein [Rhodopirellula sp. MGV]PNY36847.1 metalloenzyme domain-containing protein [Rhodopirellula baltica]